jgi:hypothetical protein
MKEEHRKKIKEIIGDMKCSKNFTCAEAGFENLCKAKDFGLDRYLECLEEHPRRCKFALPFANGFFCQCPLRVYVAKTLKK